MLSRFNRLAALSFTLLLFGCGAGTPNLSIFPYDYPVTPNDSSTVDYNKACRSLYESESVRATVAEFTNNTGYESIEAITTHTKGRANVRGTTTGVSVGTGVTVYGAKSSHNIHYVENEEQYRRQFSSNLGAFVQSTLESELSQFGNVNLYTRSDIDNIFKEQQFQMLLADPDTVVEFGQMTGVDYIISGSINNIEFKNIVSNYIPIGNNDDGVVLMFKASLNAASYAAANSSVTTDMVINVLNVETGEIVFSERKVNYHKGPKNQEGTPEFIISLAKASISESISSLDDGFWRHLQTKGYVNEMRGNKGIVLVSLGSNDGIKAGDTFDIYAANVSTDFRSGRESCEMIKIPGRIIATEQISQTTSWGIVEKGTNSDALHIGSIVTKTGNIGVAK